MPGLPGFSYVPVAARRLVAARLVYVNERLIDPRRVIEDYTFAVPTELEAADAYRDDQKEFLADRYGGNGIGINCGAGRAGQYGGFQLKGIGRTPLLGVGSLDETFWHSHGGISLVDAIQEAVWGEVFAVALPHGSARVAAIIATGTDCWYEGPGGARSRAPRALVLRQVTIRPAHFMRALYFPQPAAWPFGSDTDRVRVAIRSLADVFRQLGMARHTGEPQAIGSGLIEMIERLGRQTAHAQIRRLMHGAISPSNVALDGRWVDFGTATQLPTYANTKSKGAPRQFACLWQEQDRVRAIVEPLCFYLNKYSSLAQHGAQIASEALSSHFDATYATARNYAPASMLGLPFSILVRTANSVALRDFAQALAEVVREGNCVPVESRLDDTSSLGKNHLGLIICALARSADGGSLELGLNGIIGDPVLREVLQSRFKSVFALACAEAATFGIGSQPLATLLWIAGVKAAYSMTSLFRKNMIEDNRRLVFESGDDSCRDEMIRNKIHRLAREVTLLFAPVAGWRAILVDDGEREIAYCAREARWYARTGFSEDVLGSRLPTDMMEELLGRYFGLSAQTFAIA